MLKSLILTLLLLLPLMLLSVGELCLGSGDGGGNMAFNLGCDASALEEAVCTSSVSLSSVLWAIVFGAPLRLGGDRSLLGVETFLIKIVGPIAASIEIVDPCFVIFDPLDDL
jgi:hypothetical protein